MENVAWADLKCRHFYPQKTPFPRARVLSTYNIYILRLLLLDSDSRHSMVLLPSLRSGNESCAFLYHFSKAGKPGPRTDLGVESTFSGCLQFEIISGLCLSGFRRLLPF
jgi:hypothetical protein